jgi:aspartate/methionine/tyrosine aminotransferase
VAPPTLSQLAALAAFEPEAVAELDGHVARYARNRDRVVDGLAAMGWGGVVVPDGAFYLWCPVGALVDRGVAPSAEILCQRWLHDLGVAVTPGIDFDTVDGQRFVRFSFAGSEADVAEAMARLRAWHDAGLAAGA